MRVVTYTRNLLVPDVHVHYEASAFGVIIARRNHDNRHGSKQAKGGSSQQSTLRIPCSPYKFVIMWHDYGGKPVECNNAVNHALEAVEREASRGNRCRTKRSAPPVEDRRDAHDGDAVQQLHLNSTVG